METLLIVDFGSQYNQLIARPVREAKVFCEIVPPSISVKEIRSKSVRGIILSGGPASVYQKNSPKLNPEFLKLGVQILGICYGMQALTHLLGGHVRRARQREYGRAELFLRRRPGALFRGMPRKSVSWMSHGDYVARFPKGFVKTAYTKNTHTAAFENVREKIYGVQFHPEVVHTEYGTRLLANFLFLVCGFSKSWTMKNFIRETVERVRRRVGKRHVILGLSGGVD